MFSNLSAAVLTKNAGTSVKKGEEGQVVSRSGVFPLIIERVAHCLKGLADKFKSPQNPAGTRTDTLKPEFHQGGYSLKRGECATEML